jgi:hypothetical protein
MNRYRKNEYIKKIIEDHKNMKQNYSSHLIKIGQEEHIDSLIKGKMYMKNLKYYKGQETENEQRYDCNEGDVFQYKSVDIEFSDVGKNDFKKLGVGDIRVKDNEILNNPIFCMFSITNNNFDKRLKDQYIYSLDSDLLKFGDYSLLINDTKEFYKRINNKMSEIKKSYRYSSIEYVDYSVYDGLLGPFRKDIEYKKQKEWRLWIYDLLVEDHYILDIGSIKDISIKVKTEDLLKIVFINNFDLNANRTYSSIATKINI